MKKTIFIFIYGYLPGVKYGGPVTSIYNFTEHFGDKYDIRIVCSNHDHNESELYKNVKQGWNTVGKALVMYLDEKRYKAKTFYKIMQPFNVKMVYLTGVFSYSLNHAAIKAGKRVGAKIVIATRGEICKNILSIKKYKKIPYLFVLKHLQELKNIYFQVTSDEEEEQLKKYLNIKENHIVMLPNIHGKQLKMSHFQKKENEANMLFLSRIHRKKNLLDALNSIVQIKGKLNFHIYGPVEDKEYWKKCLEVIKMAPENVKIEYRGNLDTNEARKIYYGYDAFVFPTLSENYGHVIVEAMIASCPIIITKGTTPWDDVDKKAGYVVELHNIHALTEAIEKIIKMNSDEFNALKSSLENYRDRKLDLSKLIENYEKLIET